MTPFAPRPTTILGVESHRGYSLKVYSITYGDGPFRRGEFDAGFALALNALPTPAITPERPGVGFVILHQGQTGHYLILCWWDRENELPTHVFVTDESGWRPATGESFCVWDLEVMWREREAYVGTVLGGLKSVNYLQKPLSRDPESAEGSAVSHSLPSEDSGSRLRGSCFVSESRSPPKTPGRG